MIQLSTLKKSGLTLALLLITLISRAQLSGTITVPSVSYPDLATVVTALNTQGVAGAVTINLNTAQTAPVGGYQLGSATLNASVNASNTITFNGNGKLIRNQSNWSIDSDWFVLKVVFDGGKYLII